MTNEEVVMTKDEKFINGFLQVFENKPELFELWNAVEALDDLDRAISKMGAQSNQEVARVISDWCKKYPKITDEIRNLLKDRKLEPKPIKKESQEPMLSNRYPSLPENLRNRLPKSQQPRE